MARVLLMDWDLPKLVPNHVEKVGQTLEFFIRKKDGQAGINPFAKGAQKRRSLKTIQIFGFNT